MERRPDANRGKRPTRAPEASARLRLVHRFLGVVLIAAGAVKLYDFATETKDESAVSMVFMTFAEAELLGGLWLVAGLDPLKAHPWAVAAFGGFGAISLVQVLAGKCSCGCFGSLTVSPWFALVFDLAAIAALLMCHPFIDVEAMSSDNPGRLIGLALVPLIIAIAGWQQSTLVTVAGTATVGDKPLEEVSLTFHGGSGPLVVRTTEEGEFYLPCVRPGRYTVSRAGVEPVPESEPGARKTVKKKPGNDRASRPLTWSRRLRPHRVCG